MASAAPVGFLIAIKAPTPGIDYYLVRAHSLWKATNNNNNGRLVNTPIQNPQDVSLDEG